MIKIINYIFILYTAGLLRDWFLVGPGPNFKSNVKIEPRTKIDRTTNEEEIQESERQKLLEKRGKKDRARQGVPSVNHVSRADVLSTAW